MAGKKSALTEVQVDEIVEQYNCGFGKTIPVLAREYDVAPASIRYRLQNRGVLNTGVPMTQPPVRDEIPALSLEEAAPAAPDMAALMADPAVREMLDQLVANRMAEMIAQAAPQVATAAAAVPDQNFANVMGRFVELLSIQQPGYQKPLAADEMQSRLDGKVEMEALLASHKRAYERNNSHVLPKWRVGEKGFFECVDAIELWEGNKFSTYLAPVEDFEPLNDEAEAVYAAMMKWLGGSTPDIGEMVKNAHLAAHERVIVPGAMVSSVPKGPLVNVERDAGSDEPPRQRKRQFGTLVDEPRQIVGGTASEPVGPAYESA